MMKKISLMFAMLVAVPSFGAPVGNPPPGGGGRRVNIFSTSTDWASITGLALNEYRGHFVSDSKLVDRGMVLYYLDGFPCYGFGDRARIYIDSRGKTDNDLRIACVYPPREVKFAYRNTKSDDGDHETTGMITCNVSGNDRDLTIDLSKCSKDKNWSEYK